MAEIQTMHAKGKGVIGMKIIGNGQFVTAEDREKSVRFAMACKEIDAIVVGFTSKEQVDEATHVDLDEWKVELESASEFFQKIGATMPKPLVISGSGDSPTNCASAGSLRNQSRIRIRSTINTKPSATIVSWFRMFWFSFRIKWTTPRQQHAPGLFGHGLD